MLINRLSLVYVLTLGICVIGRAQPALPPQVPRGPSEPAPRIDAAAQKFMEQVGARYAALQSYSDVTRVSVENAAGEPANMGMGAPPRLNFRATLQWERPANIRFEGENATGKFLALGTPEMLRVISTESSNAYIARPRRPPIVSIAQDGSVTEKLDSLPVDLGAPIMELGGGGPATGLLTNPLYWGVVSNAVNSLQFDRDAQVDGQLCRVLRTEIALDAGATMVSRLFVARSDGLLRRYEARNDEMPADTFIVETHSDVRTNPSLPADTWKFEPPADAKAVETFPLLYQGSYDPDIKVGELMPAFSADALDGAPLELNAKSGKVTVVHFFTMQFGARDVQILNKLARIAGPEKLQVIGVSGDGLRPRVADFATYYGLKFPIYFDGKRYNGTLNQKFGIKTYPTTLIFGADGKLQSTIVQPDTIESKMLKAIQKALPEIGDDVLILQGDELISPE